MTSRVLPSTPRENELFEALDPVIEGVAAALLAAGPPIPVDDWKEKRGQPISEAGRVKRVIARDAAEREQDMDRKEAQSIFRKGGWANPERLVVPPTPELLASGEFEDTGALRDSYQEMHLKTKRRVTAARITKLHTAGIIDDDRFIACKFYLDKYEASGLLGSYAATKLTGESRASEQVFGSMARTEWEVEARQAFRMCRAWLDDRFIKGFDYVVLEHMGIRDAATLFRVGEKRMAMIVKLGSLRLFQELSARDMLGEKASDTQDVA